MNIDINSLTIGQAKELAALFGGAAREEAKPNPHLGKVCLIRTYASGVHCGILIDQQGRQVELKDARRLWKWQVKDNAGISLSDIAIHGVGRESKICAIVPQMTILDAIEILPLSDDAKTSIVNTEVYKP
ncbi:hypothetical protein VSS37_06630 [Candidatus Thiothrix sp. Deng01]|uniref:DUF6948 domain-containing protein n=1 Tax=Candidatus Thiothrix phosphatis TaxID=3112415 RepID=A0ABU6CX39_9GAMM|nr:hypothetical protein [Candidatus Thiothrix sp. Deng01]MEB4590647.1 hypothetical protein [Candidatus Thiothrix sp. Deng01]